MKSVSVLHTNRCTLSAVTWNDIPAIREILDDSETQRFLPELCDEFQTEDSLKQLVASFDKYLLQDDGILWGIRKDGTLIGFIAVMDIKTNPTLFYAMHSEYRNQGYMKDGLFAIMQYFYKYKKVTILHTEAYLLNKVSHNILLSLGFKISEVLEGKIKYQKCLYSNKFIV